MRHFNADFVAKTRANSDIAAGKMHRPLHVPADPETLYALVGAQVDCLSDGAFGLVMRTTRGFALKLPRTSDMDAGLCAKCKAAGVDVASHDAYAKCSSLSEAAVYAALPPALDAYTMPCVAIYPAVEHGVSVALKCGTPLDLKFNPDVDARLETCRGMAVAVAMFARFTPFAHRDLKPQNFVRHPDGSIRLVDFGASRVTGGPFSHYPTEVVTRWFRAPEVALSVPTRYDDRAVDMWALGACMLFMWSPDAFPLKGKTDEEQPAAGFGVCAASVPSRFAHLVPETHVAKPSELEHLRDAPAEFQALLDALLCGDPATRMTPAQLLADPFVRGRVPKSVTPGRVSIPPLPRLVTTPEQHESARQYGFPRAFCALYMLQACVDCKLVQPRTVAAALALVDRVVMAHGVSLDHGIVAGALYVMVTLEGHAVADMGAFCAAFPGITPAHVYDGAATVFAKEPNLWYVYYGTPLSQALDGFREEEVACMLATWVFMMHVTVMGDPRALLGDMTAMTQFCVGWARYCVGDSVLRPCLTPDVSWFPVRVVSYDPTARQFDVFSMYCKRLKNPFVDRALAMLDNDVVHTLDGAVVVEHATAEAAGSRGTAKKRPRSRHVLA